MFCSPSTDIFNSGAVIFCYFLKFSTAWHCFFNLQKYITNFLFMYICRGPYFVLWGEGGCDFGTCMGGKGRLMMHLMRQKWMHGCWVVMLRDMEALKTCFTSISISELQCFQAKIEKKSRKDIFRVVHGPNFFWQRKIVNKICSSLGLKFSFPRISHLKVWIPNCWLLEAKAVLFHFPHPRFEPECFRNFMNLKNYFKHWLENIKFNISLINLSR